MGAAFVRRRMAAELGADWQSKFQSFEQTAAAAASPNCAARSARFATRRATVNAKASTGARSPARRTRATICRTSSRTTCSSASRCPVRDASSSTTSRGATSTRRAGIRCRSSDSTCSRPARRRHSSRRRCNCTARRSGGWTLSPRRTQWRHGEARSSSAQHC